MLSETQELIEGDEGWVHGIYEREWNSKQREFHKQRPICNKHKTYSRIMA